MPYCNRIYRRALDSQFEVINSYVYESTMDEIVALIDGYATEKDWDDLDHYDLGSDTRTFV